jgi:hypothetical protein
MGSTAGVRYLVKAGIFLSSTLWTFLSNLYQDASPEVN